MRKGLIVGLLVTVCCVALSGASEFGRGFSSEWKERQEKIRNKLKEIAEKTASIPTFSKRWDRDAFRTQMAALRDRMKQLHDNLMTKLKSLTEKTKTISNTFNSQTQEIWTGYGSIVVVNARGHFISSSTDTSRIGASVPATAVDLTADMAEAACTDITVLTSVNIRVCGTGNRCKSLSTLSSVARVCPGSVSISTGTRNGIVG